MITLTIFSAISSYTTFSLAYLYLKTMARVERRDHHQGVAVTSALIVLGLAWLIAIAFGQILGG